MAYSTQAKIIAQIGLDKLVELADVDRDGSPDEALVTAAIANADGEIDSFLTERYSTPLGTVPAIVEQLSITIAVYRLASRPGYRPTEEQRQDYQDAVAALKRIHDRHQSLPGVAERTGADDKVNVGVTDGQERVFDRDTLKEF